MTPPRTRRRQPGYLIRTVVMLVASLVVCVVVLGAVDAVTRPELPAGAAAATPAKPSGGEGDEAWPASPQLGPGMAQLGLQVLLVVGIAFAGRKILKIRL